MSAYGRFCLAVDGDDARAFMGVGPIGWRRRFDWGCVTEIIEADSNFGKVVSLQGDERIDVGIGLAASKRFFLLNFLRSKL